MNAIDRRTVLFSGVFVSLSSASAGCWRSEGNGHIVVETRDLSGFTAVENDSSLPVSIVQGSEFSVAVRVDSNLLTRVETRVEDGVLRIDETEPLGASSSSAVSIVVPALDGAHNSASGDMTVTGVQQTDWVELVCTGSGTLSFSGTAGTLYAQATGSGSLSLAGSGGFTSIRVTGSGSADASRFAAAGAELETFGSGGILASVTGDASLKTTGSGSIRATLDGGSATFSVEGSGSIVWSGDERVGAVSRSGSGNVVHRE
jgi:hypothetical protein